MKATILLSTVVAALTLIATSAVAADAKELWAKNCAKCHGADGKGQTKMGKQNGCKDYTDAKVQADMKDDNAVKTIKEGITEKGKKKMDPYKDKLSDDEIKSMVAYMRSFKK